MQVGQRIEKYRILNPIASDVQNGSELWVAERVEDFEQLVAVVVPRRVSWPTGQREALDRRMRLASLHHPVIPRLLESGESGETADRQPYDLVEFIPTQPALDFARERRLARPARLALVLQFLDAISVAHRRLVAHGELTSASFQVSADGQPRLAPFPYFASSADPVAADLSAVIHFLTSVVSETEGTPLSRDMQLVLDKANNNGGAKGYESADELTADLKAALENKPVSARRKSPLYMTLLFSRRRPEVFYPAVVLPAFVLSASVYSLVMDRAAVQSRNQAQHRLHQLERLTDSLDSNLYNSVSTLPNSKPARDTLMHWTSDSLNHLADEAGEDVELRRQIAASYQHLAELQRADGEGAAAQLSEDRANGVLTAPGGH